MLKKEADGSEIKFQQMREDLECLIRKEKEKENDGFRSAPEENRGKFQRKVRRGMERKGKC